MRMRCDVAARAEDTGRCGTGPARGWRCSWSPATTHPTPTRRSSALSASNDLAMCVLPRWRVRPILRPRDYERWLWRDETTDARRRRMARTIVSPAAASATLPTYTRAGFVERDAPPNPVCGAPVGMTDATVPVAPPTPLPVPVEPPAPTAPPLPPASPPVAVSRLPAVPPVPVAVGVVVVEAGTNTSATVAMQVTALPPPFEVPLHWLMVTGSADQCRSRCNPRPALRHRCPRRSTSRCIA